MVEPVPSQLSARTVVGRIEHVDLETGLSGWAYIAEEPERRLDVELWAGDTLIAVTAADRFRADLGSEKDPRLNPGFLFSPAVLRVAALNLSLAVDAKLSVRVGDPPTMLHGAATGTIRALREAVEEAGVPAVNLTNLPLRDALDVLEGDADLIGSKPLRPTIANGLGVVERIALLDHNKLAISGWCARSFVDEQAAVLLRSEKFPAALSIVRYERTDLPAEAVGFVGVLQTNWRPSFKGAEFFLFVGEQGQHHLKTNGPLKAESFGEIEAAFSRASAVKGWSRLPELRQLLLAHQGWAAAADGGASLAIAASLDRIVLVPGFGALVDGWVLSGPRQLTGMSLRVGSTTLELDPTTANWSARPDLEKGFSAIKAGGGRAGFHAAFTGSLKRDDLLDPMLKLRFVDGLSLALPVPTGILISGDANFNVGKLERDWPGLGYDSHFARFAEARSVAVRASVLDSLQPVVVARGRSIIVMGVPKDANDASLALESASEAFRSLPQDTVLALIAEPTRSKARVLQYVRGLESAASSCNARISLTMISHVEHATLCLDALTELHQAEQIAFIDSAIWVTPEGWDEITKILQDAALGLNEPKHPRRLAVAQAFGEDAGTIDDGLFLWNRAEIQKWCRRAPAPFADVPVRRGLPGGEAPPTFPVAGLRLMAERDTFKRGLDRSFELLRGTAA